MRPKESYLVLLLIILLPRCRKLNEAKSWCSNWSLNTFLFTTSSSWQKGWDLIKLPCDIKVQIGEWFGQWAVGQGRHPNTKQRTEKQQGPFWCGILKLIWIAITLPPPHWPLSSGHLGPGNSIISYEEVEFYGSKCCWHVTALLFVRVMVTHGHSFP